MASPKGKAVKGTSATDKPAAGTSSAKTGAKSAAKSAAAPAAKRPPRRKAG